MANLGYYSSKKVAAVCLNNTRMHNFSIFATAKAGIDVHVVSRKDDSNCYTSRDWRVRGADIILGHDFYNALFPSKTKIYPATLKEDYKEMATIYLGAFYHEFFHVMYTSFSENYRLMNNLSAPFTYFAAKVSNILEDITIEGTGIFNFSYSEPYIKSLRDLFGSKEELDNLAKAVASAPNEGSTMLGYLLLYVRGIDKALLPKYKLWDDNEEFIKWGAYTCINTIDPVGRVRRQVNYALQLAKILNMKKPNKDDVTNPKSAGDMNKEASGLSGMGNSKSSSGSKVQDALDSAEGRKEDIANNPTPSKGDIVDENFKEPTRATKAQREEYSADSFSINTVDLAKEGVAQLANDEPVSRYTHIAARLDKYVNTKGQTPNYDAIVKRNERQIREVVAIIRKMLSHNNTSWSKYKMTGQFDVSTASKKDNFKFFKKKNVPSQEADLVFEILVDNSGSMSGSKTRLAGEALIIFCEALNRLHIPFAVDAFTEGKNCVTISLKDFQDSYSKVKTNMTLLTSELRCDQLSTFCGNIDEVNLMYVRDILKRQKPADKVCIVISDGATCGSWQDLRKVAQGMEKDGITVLGIGIYDDNVTRIYDKHLVLKNQSDLQKLGGFLNGYLVKKIFKGGE